MSKPPPRPSGRPRRQRREADRALRKDVRQKEQAAAALPGGDLRHPLAVVSAAVIEVQARAVICIQCGGELALHAERSSSSPRGVLREMEMICRRCHAPRTLWFRVAPSLPS